MRAERGYVKAGLQYKYLIAKLFGKQRVLKLVATRGAFNEHEVSESASVYFQERTSHLTLKLKRINAIGELFKNFPAQLNSIN